jgi:predicted enzyme related to lactoylglutathione lyase
MTQMNSVVHFEMPYDDRERLAKFYRDAFCWQTSAWISARSANDYESPNPFTGMIKKVEIHLEPEPTNRTDIDQIQKIEEATERAAQ